MPTNHVLSRHGDVPLETSDGGGVHPQRRRRAVQFVVLLFGVGVSWLLAELVVLLSVGEQPKFPRRVVEAPWGLRYNEPGSQYRHKSADVTVYFRINNQGMRADRDYTYAKPAGVKRIISLGDSFTIGYEVDVKQTFSSILAYELRAAGLNVEVLNAGVSGFSTAEEYQYLERELFKYDPDLILVSFYGNDLVDNVRTGLFTLQGSTLVEIGQQYIPAGWLGNFLNTNWLANLLAERSNAVVFLKERLTLMLKYRLARQNLEEMERTAWGAPLTEAFVPQLTGAIFNRMYEMLTARGIPLVIHSIPWRSERGEGQLIELFPLQYLDLNRPGLVFFPSQAVLRPYVGTQQLYWQRSHGHWTPFSHEIAGKALAQTILAHHLLH